MPMPLILPKSLIHQYSKAKNTNDETKFAFYTFNSCIFVVHSLCTDKKNF